MNEFCEDPIVQKRFLEIYQPPAMDGAKVKSGKTIDSI